MVAVRKHFVVTTLDRKARAYFGVSQCPTKTHQTSEQPSCKKNLFGLGLLGYFNGVTEYPHAYHQAHNEHRRIKKVQFGFGYHVGGADSDQQSTWILPKSKNANGKPLAFLLYYILNPLNNPLVLD